ncbi:MAG: DUF4114 domain-containing protein, partial [Cyanobacteria bacterium P01_A01_bin.105]
MKTSEIGWLDELSVPTGLKDDAGWAGAQIAVEMETFPIGERSLSGLSTLIAQALQGAIHQILSAPREQISDLLGAGASGLIQSLQSRPLTLELVPIADLLAKGAYAVGQDKIYLAEEWVAHQSVEAVTAVIVEEIGHWLDDRLNAVDTGGDEGAMFAALVQGTALSTAEWDDLRAEDDRTTFVWQGQHLTIEKADLGEFSVNASGQVSVDFVFDNGAYAGELAVYDLTGMDGFQVGSAAYIQEAARRALSDSTAGHIVISDIAEGAQRSGNLGEADQGTGPVAAARTFSLTAGSRFALMLVPNGTVQEVFEAPDSGNSLRPLFSLGAANPGGAHHLAQVTDGVFSLEDLRVDEGSDQDYNDIVFSLQGATGQAVQIKTVIAPDQDWLEAPDAQQLFNLTTETVPGTALPPNLVGTPVTASFTRQGVLLSDNPTLAEGDIAATVPR